MKPLQPRRRITYYLLKPLIILLTFICYHVKVYGTQNIPKKGSFILAANHISFADPGVLIAVCPRTCHFMAKSELFSNRLIGAFLRSMNAFPVRRGTSDSSSLDYAQAVINKGYVLGIFPEGARQKDRLPKTAKSGVAFLARQTKADVLPVCIYHSPDEHGKIRPRLTIRFGEVIPYEKLGFTEGGKTSEMKSAAQTIMQAIVSLWEKKHEKE